MTATRHPPYRIRTERLVVRCWSPEDAAPLHQALAESRDHLLPWLPWAAEEPTSVERKIEMLRLFRGRFDLGEEFVYGVFDKRERRVLGGAGLHARVGPSAYEIGYWIRAGETRRGFGTEVAAALTKVAFTVLEVDRVEIRVEPTNDASLAIPKKLGFEREGTLRRRHPSMDGQLKDLVVWSLFAASYPKSPAAKTKVQAWDAGAREITSLAKPSTRRARTR